MNETRVLVGVFGAAQGVRGEVRLKSYTGDPRAVGTYGPLASDDGRSFEILSSRLVKDDMLVVRIAGVADRAAAAALTGTRLYVDRSRLPAPDPDEVYHVDLIGLTAFDEDGAALGRVAAIDNHGAGDILEIARGSRDSLLVPFTRGFVPEIDLAAGRLVVARGALSEDDEGPEGA